MGVPFSPFYSLSLPLRFPCLMHARTTSRFRDHTRSPLLPSSPPLLFTFPAPFGHSESGSIYVFCAACV